MVTALLIVLAVLVVLAIVGVVFQMSNSPLMCVFHLCSGTVGFLAELLGALLTEIGKGLKS
jgi:hypothetical protein